ncbi:iron transporter [Halorientalis brevis]|uniref:Iron transporter n=1 Tax=Halorientalis brevis TaxID=1126241 RepID=A0ABD6CBG8_9EURY|nr:iron transporter [Halorientalis brevis]
MSGKHTLQPSEEVDERHLELARHEGEAYQRAAKHMVDEVAHTGAMTEVGDYVVGFAQEEAEGLYHVRDGALQWEEPAENQNCHLEVLVAETETGRFLPEMSPRATLTDQEGNQTGPMEVPFVWHPGLLHYGRNFELPGAGTYEITIELDPPAFPRHDEQNGERFDEPIEAHFQNVEIEPGRK